MMPFYWAILGVYYGHRNNLLQILFFKFLTFEMTFEHVNVSVTTGDM